MTHICARSTAQPTAITITDLMTKLPPPQGSRFEVWIHKSFTLTFPLLDLALLSHIETLTQPLQGAQTERLTTQANAMTPHQFELSLRQ